MTGIVTGFKIDKNRNGSSNVVLLQVRISAQNDIQTVELMTPPGDDSIPPNGSRVLILQATPSWKIAIANQDSLDPLLAQGEKRIYSQSGGSEQAYIHLKNDGVAEINGDAQSAVRFQDLATALNNFRASIESSISGAIAGHTHAETGTVTGPGTGSAPPVVLDISAAESQEVKLP